MRRDKLLYTFQKHIFTKKCIIIIIIISCYKKTNNIAVVFSQLDSMILNE